MRWRSQNKQKSNDGAAGCQPVDNRPIADFQLDALPCPDRHSLLHFMVAKIAAVFSAPSRASKVFEEFANRLLMKSSFRQTNLLEQLI